MADCTGQHPLAVTHLAIQAATPNPDFSMNTFGKKPDGLRLERMRASLLWAGDGLGFCNRHPVLPGLRDPAAPRPSLREFLFGGERRVPTGPLPAPPQIT